MARTDIFTSIRSSLSSEEPWAAAKACRNIQNLCISINGFLTFLEKYPFVATHLKEEEEEIMDCCQGLHKTYIIFAFHSMGFALS
jgi:hypothetical protein